MKNFLYETIILTYNKNNITEMCKEMPLNINCNYFRGYVDRNINKLQYEKQRLFTHLRTKRGLFSFLKTFFPCICSLDQSSIDELQNTDTENRNFTATHIIINKDTLKMNKNFLNNISKDIFAIHKSIKQIKRNNIESQKEMQINNFIMLTILAIDEHLKKMNQIIRIMLYKQTIDIIDVINTEEIEIMISEINKTLTGDQKFLANNPIDIMNTGTLNTRTTNETIIIKIEIPIENEQEQYKSYKIIPIPFKGRDGTLYRIKSIGSYILHNSQETLMTDLFKLNTCRVMTTNNNLICSIEEITDQGNNCEVAIFKNIKPNNCPLEKFNAFAHITRIQANTFYCVVNKKYKFEINCKEFTDTIELTQNSWFTVNDDCFINFTGRIYYTPKRVMTKEIEILKSNQTITLINSKQILLKYKSDSNSVIIQDPLINNGKINVETDNKTKQLDELEGTVIIPKKIEIQSSHTVMMLCFIVFIVIIVLIRYMIIIICGKPQ